MLLEGSCHCQAVRFSLQSDQPLPFQRCYCGICRKVGGGGGYLINLGGRADTLSVQGAEHTRVYRARVQRARGLERSQHERHFCVLCGTHLWAFHPEWPQWVHPVAGAIDTALPVPTRTRHMMVAFKAGWVRLDRNQADELADGYPPTSLAQWHEDHGYTDRSPQGG